MGLEWKTTHSDTFSGQISAPLSGAFLSAHILRAAVKEVPEGGEEDPKEEGRETESPNYSQTLTYSSA